ncbi:MAG: putative GTP-binding protein EngB [Candidatus Nomurabacteria bacterium GW2011_GWE2_36_115]|nr:MAG: putative GTP-binding protein EngB [Candidatus Nomurabacteria bacterium GW2011_GWE2_36_115]
MKGIVGDDEILADGIPQIAFIGRRTSSFPGRTQEINIFLINNAFYLVDLPGYGFARASGLGREKIGELIDSYLFNSIYTQKKVVMIIDAGVGMTDKDILMLNELRNHHKDFIIVANKTDKLKQSDYHKKMAEIKKVVGDHPIIPFSNKTRKGVLTLVDEIFK